MNKEICNAIEVHSHMFNGHYVPLEEFLYFRLFKEKHRKLAIVIGKILKFCIRKKSDKASGVIELKNVISSVDEKGEILLSKYIANVMFGKLEIITTGYSKKTVRSKLENSRMAKTMQAFFNIHESIEGIESKLIFVDRFINDKRSTKNYFSKSLAGYFKPDKAKSYLRFVATMLMNDGELYTQLLNKNYTHENNKVDLFVHLTMDIEAAYLTVRKHPRDVIGPKFDFLTKQIDRSDKFIKKSKGRLLGFVAFHPERGEKGMETCFNAIEKGHIGIKIYPPLNYRPDGVPMQGTEFRKEVKDYRKIMQRFYSRCVEQSVPLLAHCTPVGFEPWEGTGPLANPKYWINVLSEYKKLRICFGHCGGGHFEYYDIYSEDPSHYRKTDGWYANPKDWNENPEEEKTNYAKQIVNLCDTYDNVYADMSYLHEVLSNKGYNDNFKENFKSELQKLNSKFNIKVMFGSDWHMASLLGKTDQYMKYFNDFFNQKDCRHLKDSFFFRNAIRFLNLK